MLSNYVYGNYVSLQFLQVNSVVKYDLFITNFTCTTCISGISWALQHCCMHFVLHRDRFEAIKAYLKIHYHQI